MSSIRGMSAKPPNLLNTEARTKMDWSPNSGPANELTRRTRLSHKTTEARRSSKRRWNAPPEIKSLLAAFSNALQVLGTQLGIGVMKTE